MKKITKSAQASVIKKTAEFYQDYSMEFSKKNISSMSTDEISALCDTYKTCTELKDIFGAVGKIDKFMKYADDIEDMSFKVAKAEAIVKQANETAKILLLMKNYTSNQEFKDALDNLILSCQKNHNRCRYYSSVYDGNYSRRFK